MALAATTAAAPANANLSSPSSVDFTPNNATVFSTSLFKADDPKTIPHMPCAWCQRRKAAAGMTWEYKIYVQMVPKWNWDMLCEKLWRELKQFQALCMVSKAHCGVAGMPGEDLDDIVKWEFQAGLGCNPGAVEAAYWEATHNIYGKMDMRLCETS